MSVSGNVEPQAFFDVTVASGTGTSAAFRTFGFRAIAVETPGTITGTAMALHGASTEGSTFKPLIDAGGAVSESTSADQIVIFGEVVATPWMKLVSNANEGAARTYRVYLWI